MMMSWMSVLMFVLSASLGRGGGNELITYLPTQEYWQSKNITITLETMAAELKAPAEPPVQPDEASLKALEEAARSKDPALAGPARSLLIQARAGDKPGQVRRLMAIRALGEMKDPRAAELLRPLTASTEPFIADHAHRAIARIEGRPMTLPAPDPAAREADLGLLPADMGAVGQAVLGGGAEITLAELLAQLPPELNEPRRELPQMLVRHLLPIIERTGNIRLDSVTFGVSSDIGQRGGCFIAIARGQYDPAALGFVIGEQGKSEQVDGLTVYRPGPDVAVVLFDAERAVFIAGEDGPNLPVGKLIAHLKAGKGSLHENAEMGRLLASVDRTQPMWAVMRTLPILRPEDPIFRAFDTMHWSSGRRMARCAWRPAPPARTPPRSNRRPSVSATWSRGAWWRWNAPPSGRRSFARTWRS